MHFTPLAAALALSSTVLAVPFAGQKRDVNTTVPNVIGSSKFTVAQDQPKRDGRKLAGPIALADALSKYERVGLSPPPAVEAAAAKAQQTDDGTVAASPSQFDQLYLSPVTIGGQTFNLDFDTGSSDLWVFSSKLSASVKNGHSVYKPGQTAQLLRGASWKISYGDGSSASGSVYTDTVDVGGTTVESQAIELATKISDSFSKSPGDGLLGLAFSSINTVQPTQQKTFFDNAIQSLDAPLFAVDLKKGQPGTYDFGFIDDSKHTGDITYTDVDSSEGFWQFTVSGYAIGGGKATKGSIKAIADTGTSLLLLEQSVVDAYWAQVEGAQNSDQEGGYVFPCNAKLPDISLQIEGYAAITPGSLINYAPASQQGTCYGGVQSSGDLGLSILGDVFLKAQYVVFSNDGPQLGFAPKNIGDESI